VSQPAISKQLKNLEREYGVRLFEREGVTGQLTDAGRTLLRHVKLILVQLDAIKQKIRHPITLTGTEPLKIAGSFASSALLLPSVLAIFKRKHRNTPIVLRTGTTRDAKRMLLNSVVEIAVLNAIPTDVNIFSEPFREEKLVLFAAPTHPLAKKVQLSVSDLNTATLVTPGKASTVDRFLKDLGEEGIKTKIAIRCGTPESVKTIVKKGVGVGILFKDLVAPEIKDKIFKQLVVPGLTLKVQSYIIYYKDRPLSSPADQFLNLLRKRSHRRVHGRKLQI
jgi:DNA-binding transcriptional LysR family regulator